MFDSEDFENLPEEIKKFILSLLTPNDNPKKTDFKKLGPPTTVESFTDNGINFIKKTWKRKSGDIVQILPNMDDFEFDEYIEIYEKPMVSLERQLEIALENENYEEAAKVRDKINGKDLDEIIKTKHKENKIKRKSKSKKSDEDIWDI